MRLTDDGSMEESDAVLAFAYLYGSPENRRRRGFELTDSKRWQVVVRLERLGGELLWVGEEEVDVHVALGDVTHWAPLPPEPDVE